MTTFKHALLRSSMMTPTERRVGRFLRAPDGHDAGVPAPAAAAPASEPAAEPAAAAPAPAAPQPVVLETDALYEQEYGGAADPASDDGKPGEGEAEGVSDEGKGAKEEPAPAETPEAKALREANERADRAEREASELRKGKEPTKDEPKPAQPTEEAPKPEDYEFGEADGKYIAALARFEARQEYQAQQQETALRTELAGIEKGWSEAITAPEIAAEYPDFDEKVTKGADRGDWHCTPLMALAIKASPVGADVAYELASNKDESIRIAKLIPVEQAHELGKLEGKAMARREAKAAAAPTPKPTTKVSSTAPTPPTAVSRGAGGKFVSDGDAMYDKMLSEFR